MTKTQNGKKFNAGDIIIHQGDPGECAYIIESGRVEILIERPDAPPQSVGTRGAGTMIGEMAIIDDAPRTATVKALEPCELLEITQEDLLRRMSKADPILRMTLQVIMTRYRDMLTRADIIHESPNWPPPEALELNYAEQTDAVENIKIANEFKDALDADELALHYQPIIDLNTQDIAGFEALMRWNHPEKGAISPGLFIPVAEDSGLIVSASQWALKEACTALKRVEQRCDHPNRLFMSVNFSSTDFASEGFVESVHGTLQSSDVLPEQLHLEITERLLMGQPENAKGTLETLQKAGMHISIDDFGTGYSSLSYLHYFPIDTLKIDQSFIRNITQDDSSLELVRSIIGLGKNLKMNIIAEGVEEKEEALLLQEMGCDMVQGFYFAKPMTEADLIAYMKQDNRAKL